MQKGKKSAKKVLVFLKYSSVASNLFKTSSYQMLKYSYRNFGFAPSKLTEIDYMGGRCIKKYGFQPCHFTQLVTSLDWVPSLELVKGQIDWWCRYLRDSITRPGEVAKVWVEKYRKLSQHRNKWSVVDGPIAATIATVLDVGWDPVLPNQWNRNVPTGQVNEDGSTATEVEFAHLNKYIWAGFQISQQLVSDYRKSIWKKASLHYAGRGLEEGEPSFHGFHQAKKMFSKQEQSKYIPFLHKVTQGGVVTGDRYHCPPLVCDVCGRLETKKHRGYLCKHLCTAQDDFQKHWLQKSYGLQLKVENIEDHHDCLWYRGIVPHTLCYGKLNNDGSPRTRSYVVGDLSGNNLMLAGDGGGTPKRPDPLFKVFSGGAVISWGDDFEIKGVGMVMSSVPSQYQTVPRAEVFAPLITLQALNLEPTRVGSWCSDSTYVTINSNKLATLHPNGLRKSCLNSKHGDIWASLQEFLCNGSLPLPTKVEGHVFEKGKEVSDPLQFKLSFANVLADVAATIASSWYDHVFSVCLEVEKYLTFGFLVSVRFAIVEYNLACWRDLHKVKRTLPPVPPPVSQEDFRSLVCNTISSRGHILQQHLNGVHLICTRCRGQKPKSSTLFWETTPCVEYEYSPSPPPLLVNKVEDDPTQFYGLASDFSVLSSKRQSEVSQIAKGNTSALKEARRCFHKGCSWLFSGSASVSTVTLGVGLQSFLTPWMHKAHHTHELWTAGGLIFCTKCGCTQAQPRKSRLLEDCIPLPEYSPLKPTVKHGSWGRVTLLKAGSLKGTHLKRWPSGVDGKVRIIPKRFFVSPPTLPKPPAKLVLAEREVSEVDMSSALPRQPQFSNVPFSSNLVLVRSLIN